MRRLLSMPVSALPPIPWAPVLAGVCVAMWVGMLGLKAWFITRTPFHWDEFWFLSLVHAGWRGELQNGFQMLHVVLFAWLPGVGSEVQQLRAGRWVMWALLVLSSWLIYRLSRRWVPFLPALTAPVIFLAFKPVAIHAGSFRSDGLLLPMCLGVLCLLAKPSSSRRDWAWAGALWGVSAAVSIKTIFLAPVVLFALCAGVRLGRTVLHACAWVGVFAAIGLATSWWIMHALLDFSLPAMASTAQSVSDKMFSQWLPRSNIAAFYILRDKLAWVLLLLGALVAIARRSPIVGFSLALMPVTFYRNAYEYYYPLMLAPVCVLAAYATDALLQGRATHGTIKNTPPHGHWVLALVVCGIYMLAFGNYWDLSRNTRQVDQVQVLAAVHQVFPEPVPYLDHSGTVASFSKVNGFLSTWGIENYQAANRPLLPDLLRSNHAPPLLLADRNVLPPTGKRFKRLLPEDQRLIRETYLPYWGPIWIAGVRVPATGRLLVHLPGRYRVDGAAVRLNGKRYSAGDIITITAEHAKRGLSVSRLQDGSTTLWWAAAHPAPIKTPPMEFFDLPK